MRNQRRKTRLFKRLALAFAIALVAVPVAQAYPDEGANVQAAAPIQLWPGVDPNAVSSEAVATESLPTVQSWPGVDPQVVPSDAVQVRTVPMPRPWPGIASISANPNRVAATESIDWGDSGVGAATALALILLAAGSLVAVRGVGRQATPA